QYQPIPGEQHAGLSGGDLAVIFADQTRSLRNEQDAPGRAVIDVPRHLSGDLAGKVRTNASDECGRDDAAGLHDIERGRRYQTLDADGALARRLRHKGALSGLIALRRLGGLRSGSARRSDVPQNRNGRSGPGAAAAEEHAAHSGGVAFLLRALPRCFGTLLTRIRLPGSYLRDRNIFPTLLG